MKSKEKVEIITEFWDWSKMCAIKVKMVWKKYEKVKNVKVT